MAVYLIKSLLLSICLDQVAASALSLNTLRAGTSRWLSSRADFGFPEEVIPPHGLKLGDNSVFDDPDSSDSVELCRRAGALSIACIAARPKDCDDPRTGQQRRLQDLTDSQHDRIWKYATKSGQATRRKMNWRVSRRESRLIVDPEYAGQDDKSRAFYRSAKPIVTKKKISNEIYGMAEAFDAAKCSVDGDGEFSYMEVFSSIPMLDTNFPVLEVGASPDDSVIISTASYAENDNNSPENRAYSSTLTWASWKIMNEDDVSKAKALKYHMRAYITNDETLNTMRLAHQKFPNKVTDLPMTGDVEGGHGIWVPGDEAYDALLNSPLVKISAHIVMDRNIEMDNPYVVEIHTFGEIITPPIPGGIAPAFGSHIRHPMIIIKYGKPPPDALQLLPEIIDTE